MQSRDKYSMHKSELGEEQRKDELEDGAAGNRPRGLTDDEQWSEMQEILLNCCDGGRVDDEGDERCGDARW